MVTPHPIRSKPQPTYSSSSSSFQQKMNDQKSLTTNDYRPQHRSKSLTTPQADQTHDNRRPSSPAISSTPRLSIADRFMSSSSSSFSHQHSPLTPSSLSYSSPILNENENMPSENLNTARSPSPTPPTRHPSSNTLTPISEQTTSRLTIASAFMKNSSGSLKNEESNTTIHPLDTSLDRSGGSFELNLDLSPTPTSPSSHQARPFGSQDTLVNSKHQQRQKRHSNEEYYNVALDDYYQQRQPDEEDEEDERHENSSDLSSITRHGDEENDLDLQQNKLKGKQSDMDMDDEPHGYWIGCCFLSCGKRRPSKKTMMMNSKKRQQRRKQQQRKCGRRWRVFSLFLGVVFLIVLSSMLWPRTPLIRIEGASLLSPAKITETSQGAMLGNVQFESQWTVNFTVDNRQNWLLPTRLVQLHVLVKDALTGNVIGKGLQNDHPETLVLDPRAISTVQQGVSLDYQARDVSDTTFASLKKACLPPMVPSTRKRSLLASRAEPNHNGGDGNRNNTTLVPPGTNHTLSSNNNNSTNANNQTLSHPFSPIFPPSTKEREPLSLLFWVTLHIWGVDVFGYRPTVMVAPATGGFLCPLS